MNYQIPRIKSHYCKKKVRGVKRQLKSLRIRLAEMSRSFHPEHYDQCGYYHYHLPCSRCLFYSTKSSHKLRQVAIRTLIESAVNLRNIRPRESAESRIVIAIDLPKVWDSQLIIFYSEEYFENFFNRNESDQTWTLLAGSENFISAFQLEIPNGFRVRGYAESINEVDYQHEGEVWFIGEV